ncbi:hypothetical protein GJ496_001790 [Pomphorhynchus laevis]|nr:hypothetical protein GJ496_001790 [Pomphorhynchus laevis]
MDERKAACELVARAIVVGKRGVHGNYLGTTKLIPGYYGLLGVDVIEQLGGLRIDAEGKMQLMDGITTSYDVLKTVCTASVEPVSIDNVDVSAKFESGTWIVAWILKAQPPKLNNLCARYNMTK